MRALFENIFQPDLQLPPAINPNSSECAYTHSKNVFEMLSNSNSVAPRKFPEVRFVDSNSRFNDSNEYFFFVNNVKADYSTPFFGIQLHC